MASQISTSYVRQSYQILVELSTDKFNSQTAFEKASKIVYEWGKNKFHRIFYTALPEKLQFVNLSKDSNELGVIYQPDDGLFVFRAVHLDSTVAGRSWTTDVQLSRSDSKTIFATKLSVTSLKTCKEDIRRSTPRFISEIASEIGFDDIYNMDGQQHILSTFDDVDFFIDFLEAPERFMPVVLITPSGTCSDAFLLNPSQMSKDLIGIAHVFTITSEANNYFKNQIGTSWAAYSGAVRTYYPHLSFAESNYYQHPLITPKKIQLLNSQAKTESDKFSTEDCMSQIEEHIKKYSVISIINWEEYGINFFLKEYQNILRRKQSEHSKESHQEQIESYQEQISQLKKERDEIDARAKSLETDLNHIQKQDAEQHQKIFDLNAQILHLRAALQAKTGQPDGEEVPLNGTYSEIKDWVKKYYPDRLTLLPRAERSLKNAVYEDVELVYKSLKLLATSYYRHRMGEIDRDTFLQHCKDVDPGLSEARAITDVAAGQEGDTYNVWYHGENHRLDHHLTKGNSRDRKYCLRIYFFWDDEDQTVVIGDLPHHLDTSAT